jgi:hypothetical protein
MTQRMKYVPHQSSRIRIRDVRSYISSIPLELYGRLEVQTEHNGGAETSGPLENVCAVFLNSSCF